MSWALLEAEIEYAGWESAAGFLESRRNGEAGWWRLEPAVVATTIVLDTLAPLRPLDSVTATAAAGGAKHGLPGAAGGHAGPVRLFGRHGRG